MGRAAACFSEKPAGSFHMKHWQKKELFHVKHYRKPLVFLHLREDGQSDPEFRTRDNAECALESLAKPAGLVLRTG